MPMYDYRCAQCGEVREHRQKISDPPLTECPECGGEYKRIITSVGIIFKGSGFHINDYKGSKGSGGDDREPTPPKKSDGDASKKDQSSSDSGSEKSGESKGETKSGDTASSSGTQDKQVA